MSFSSLVKQELAVQQTGYPRHCLIAEILSFLNQSAQIGYLSSGYYIDLRTENYYGAKRFYTLIRDAFSYSCGVSVRKNQRLNKFSCRVTVTDQKTAEKILMAAALIKAEAPGVIHKRAVDHLLLKNDCCKRAYLRGAFIINGSLSDPAKNYHLEYVFSDEEIAQEVVRLLNGYGLNGKIVVRKGYYVVYLKEGEHIVDLLNIIGAHNCLMDLENIRILKDISNNVNRIVNFETANLSKTVNAAVKQVEDIQFIYQSKGGDYLEPPLREIAELRLSNPNATLKEIGEMLTPGISKSGVNHRLRRISDIADKLRSDHYG